MFRGFELKIDEGHFSAKYDPYSDFKKEGLYQKSGFQRNYEKMLQSVTEDATFSINGNKIEEEWFPKFPGSFHVFLSHSHTDKDLAVAIAGLLKEKLNLDVFIDSLVWGYRDQLVRLLYDKTGRLNDTVSSIYSHVDCMLTKSLIEMMDSCECLLFLNTPQSVSIKDTVEQTHSPWIYAELEASRLLRRHKDEARRNRQVFEYGTFSEKQASEQLNISYNIPKHLSKLSDGQFSQWMNRSRERRNFYALDELYRLVPIDPQTTML